MSYVSCIKSFDKATNYASGAKTSKQPVFVSKVLLEPRHTHLFKYYLWQLSDYRNRESNFDRDYMARKPKILTF